LIRGERLVLCIAIVILSEPKNLGSNSELIHNRNRPEMFRFAQHHSAFGGVARTLF
jgi:hypothetical protein